MNKYQTLDHLEEKVFVLNSSESEDNNDYELNSFFNELLSRRRNDYLEGGLQACGVVFSEKAGFKIAERDGSATHAHTDESIAQYLNGETMFSGEDTLGQFNLRKNDPNAWINLPKNSFTVRIVASKDHLIFVFNTYQYKISPFQLEVIEKTFNKIKQAYQNGIIKYPYINYTTREDRFIFNEDENIDEQLNKLEEIINKRKDKTRTI